MEYPQDSEKLTALLEHFNINSAELARQLNYKSPSSVYHVERGLVPISRKMALKIIDLHPQVNFEYLIGKSEEMIADEEMQNQQLYLKAAYNAAEGDFKEKINGLIISVEEMKRQNNLILKAIKKLSK